MLSELFFDPWKDLLARRAYEKRRAQGFQIIRISFPERIGHLCCETDALLKDLILEGFSMPRLFLPDIGERFANRHVVDYFARYISIEKDAALERYLRRPSGDTTSIIETHPYAVAMYETARVYAVNARWGDRPPLFTISNSDQLALQDFLTNVGLPSGSWFVCLHAREGGYSPVDEAIHGYRSISIQSYTKAVQEIIKRGGWVMRLGDASMSPYSPHPRVIDYARSPHRSAQMDVALTAGCKLFLGSASGMAGLATMFGRPSVICNTAPLGAALGLAPGDLSIPQRLRDKDGRLLGLSELLSDESSMFRLSEEFTERGLSHEPNSPAEILDITVEMLNRLDGTQAYSEHDHARQQKFKDMFRPGHYTYGAAAQLGCDYLKVHLDR